jgi:hypothetical protein
VGAPGPAEINYFAQLVTHKGEFVMLINETAARFADTYL